MDELMRALCYPAAGETRLETRDTPEPGPGEVLLAVRASGLCHTDIDVLHARYGPGAFPVVPGHEYAGEVLALGPGVSGLAEGDRVVVDPNFGCGTCRACRRGRSNLCDALGAYGVTRDGGFATHSVVAAENLVPVGDMDLSLAALAEPMGCALNGLSALAPAPDDEALIFGAGPMGLLLALALKARGLARIAFVDPDTSRLDLAESFGFAPVPAASDDLARRRHAQDIVADATGKSAVAARLPDYAAAGGACLFFGVCPPGETIPVSPFELFRRQITLAGTHSLNRNLPEALDAIRAAGPDIGRLVSHRVGLDGIAAILRDGAPRGSLKVQASMA